MTQTLSISTDARGVARLTLDRPAKHNALSAKMIAELTKAAVDLGVSDQVRAVVLTGAGKSFCAGGDLAWMQEQMRADPQTRGREAAKLAHMLQALNTMPKPLIGALQGNAFGGGVGLASVCDVAIGVDHLKMGLTETRLGIIPATIGPYVLARMGEGRARRGGAEAEPAAEVGSRGAAVADGALVGLGQPRGGRGGAHEGRRRADGRAIDRGHDDMQTIRRIKGHHALDSGTFLLDIVFKPHCFPISFRPPAEPHAVVFGARIAGQGP